MAITELFYAVILGALQGMFEWLPISSEGNVAITNTLLTQASATTAVGYALFLHLGTAISATLFYRQDLGDLLEPSRKADRRFLLMATGISAIAGVTLFLTMREAMTNLQGVQFVAIVGGLLVLTGLFQWRSQSLALGERDRPSMLDGALIGLLQGLAILPGISRSGMTVSGLLLRRFEQRRALDLSFVLSIPAAIGAATLAVGTETIAISLLPALLALSTSAIVGYITIGTLVDIVERVAVWAVCLGLGSLAIVGALVYSVL